MKIAAIDTLVVDAGMRNWVLVKVQTDTAGLHGWGEATLEWKARSVCAAVEDLKVLLLGEDPRNITRCSQIMKKRSYWRLGAIGQSAVSAIEMALWDITGKELNVPVWRLLGGCVRSKVRVYTHLGMGEMNAVYNSFAGDKLVEQCEALRQRGYGAAKIVNVPYSHFSSENAAIDAFANGVHQLREALGSDFAIMIDFHGRPASPRVALDYLNAIRSARIMFAEEPIQPGNTQGLVELRSRSDVPIASGERLVEGQEFEDLLTARAVDIVQPDLCHCGGLAAARQVAQRAELLGVGIAPHNPAGPIATAAALHFALATPNHVIQEEMAGAVPWFDELLSLSPIVRDSGYWLVPEAPGLGVEIDEVVAARHPPTEESQLPRDAVMADGTIVDW